MGSKMYSPPLKEGKKFYIQVRRASPPNFQECLFPSTLKVSATCRRCSRVWRGRIDDRPKPSMMVGILVSGSVLLGLDCCKSRENWARRRLTTRNDRLLVSVAEALSVETSSSPLSLIPKLVSGLAGSRKTLVCP